MMLPKVQVNGFREGSWMGKDIDRVDVLVDGGRDACSGETLTDGEWAGVDKTNFNSTCFTKGHTCSHCLRLHYGCLELKFRVEKEERRPKGR